MDLRKSKWLGDGKLEACSLCFDVFVFVLDEDEKERKEEGKYVDPVCYFCKRPLQGVAGRSRLKEPSPWNENNIKFMEDGRN